MKDWERKILKSKTDRDTRLVVNDKGSWVCRIAHGRYLLKCDPSIRIMNIREIINTHEVVAESEVAGL